MSLHRSGGTDMRRDSADVPTEVFARPGRRFSRSVPPVALAGVRGRAVARLPSAPVRRWPSGRARLAVRRHRRQLHGLDAWARAEISSIPSRRLPPWPRLRRSRRAEPDPTTSRCSRSCLSWNFVPCRGPISRCLRERPLREDRDPPSADGCHTAGLDPSSWFFTTSTVSSVHELRHVAAGTGSGFARFRSGRSSEPKLVGPGPMSPLAHHPSKGSSSSVAVPHRCGLLPSCRSFRPRPKTWWRLGRLDPSLPTTPFPTLPPGSRSRLPSASRRWVSCFGAPSVRRRAGCPTHLRGVRLDRVESPVARLWCSPTVAPFAGSPLSAPGRVRRSALTDRVPDPTSSPSIARERRSTWNSVSDIAVRRSVPSVVALRPDARPPGSSVDRVVPSTSVTWRSVHAPAGFRVSLHRRVRVPRRRCRRHVTRSFLGFFSPSRLGLHLRRCLRSPEGPIPLPVCVWAALSSRSSRRTAEGVCPVVEGATVAGHGLPGVLDVKEQLVANLGSKPSPEGVRLSPLRRS